MDGEEDPFDIELRILRTSRHPFIITYKCDFEKSGELYFIMEYANRGDLFSLMVKVSCPSTKRAFLVFASGSANSIGEEG